MKKALTIAGSDNSGGAGIQADLKVFSAFGVYGMSAITAITIQNSLGVISTHPVEPEILYSQISSIAEDIGIDAAKTGMLMNRENVETVYKTQQKYKFPLIVDPVIKSKNGRFLLEEDAIEIFIQKIIPISLIITPNKDEAEVITGKEISSIEDMKKAAIEIKKMGAHTVVIKGGHLPQDKTVTDIVLHEDEFIFLTYPFVDTKNTHGTGCTFSAAITALIAKGIKPLKAIRIARAYVQGAIENSLKTGQGTGSLNHFWTVM